MKRMFFLLPVLMLIASCSAKEDPDAAMDIVGSWHEISYLCSDGYYIAIDDGRTYVFNPDDTYMYDDGFLAENGTFRADSGTNIVRLVSSERKKRSIVVAFENEDLATFKTVGSTSKYERR